MSERLPEDLQRLGDQLAEATLRATAAERRRRRTARIAMLALLPLVASAAFLGKSGDVTRTATTIASVTTPAEHRPGCDHARSATFAYPRACSRPAPVVGPGVDPRLILKFR